MKSHRREFTVEILRQAWARCGGHCEHCTAVLAPGAIDYDHVIPSALGGDPTLKNCQVLCRTCHRLKTAKTDVPTISRAARRGEKHFGMRRPRGFGFGTLKRRMDGSVVRSDP